MNKLERADCGFAQVKNDVLCDPSISMKAKCMFAYIYSKPNKWDFSVHRVVLEMKESVKTINNALKELETAGYLARKRQKTGRVTYFCSYKKPDVLKYHEAEKPDGRIDYESKLPLVDSTTVSNTEIINTDNIRNTYSLPTEEQKQEFGNSDINNLLSCFEKIRGFKSSGGKKDRYMAKHLLNNFTLDQIKAMLLYLDQDQYAPRIGSISDLWHQRGKIVAGIKQMQSNKTKVRSL